MTARASRLPRGVVPSLCVGAVVALVTWGLALGPWLPNLHNGLLSLAFALVGAYVLRQRPGHREGVLLVAVGAVQAVLFWGRQVGHTGDPGSGVVQWAAWLGVWPVAIGIALVTLAVVAFPDGRLPSPRWRPLAVAVVLVALACASVSALWPVEYAATGTDVAHPFSGPAPRTVDAVWSAVAHPVYALLQLLWPVAVGLRWRGATGWVRRQLAWLLVASGAALLVLVAGLAGWRSPTPGLLAATLVPVVAGVAVVHGRHAAAYSALTWLSRRGPADDDLATDLARATSEALGAPATLWLGTDDRLQAVGAWPPAPDDPAPVTAVDLPPSSRTVALATGLVGVLGVERSAPLSGSEVRLLDDLGAQAGLVLERLTLGEIVERERRAGHLDGLTPREQEVLALMAEGLSNAAICERLHLSVKTVEPAVGSVFAKLQLHQQPGTNRRVLAVLAYLRSEGDRARRP